MYSGIAYADSSRVTLNINEDVNSGFVHLNISDNLGSETTPLYVLRLNGGVFSVQNGVYSDIYTTTLELPNSTEYMFDIDLTTGESDIIHILGGRKDDILNGDDHENKLVLTRDFFNSLTSDVTTSVKVKVLDIIGKTSDYLTFEDNQTVIRLVQNEIVYYAQLGLNGSIIIGTNPDNSENGLVKAIANTKSSTYKLSEDTTLFNYGLVQQTSEPTNPVLINNPTGNVVQSKKLTIKGSNNAKLTTPSSLQGFVVGSAIAKQQLVASNFTMSGFDGAVINNGGTVTLTNVNLLNNESEQRGSAIRNNGGKVTLKGTKKLYAQVYNNTSNDFGGAIYNAGTLTAQYVQFGNLSNVDKLGNNSLYGGALYNTLTATISSSNFVSNSSDSMGGAVYTNSNLKSTSTTYKYNEAVNGGGIYAASNETKTPTLTISSNNFYSNTAKENGGAVYIESAKTTISKTNFGLSTDPVTSNTAKNGGAIYNNEKNINKVSIKSSKFYNNTTEETGGAIYNGGILSDSSSVFQYNTSLLGAGIYNAFNATLTLSKTNFTSNTSTLGGALYNIGSAVTYNKKGAVTGGINSAKFTTNTAELGGAVYNTGIVGISKSTFTGNNAQTGGAIYNEKDATIISSTFIQNKAEEAGGAVYNTKDAVLTLKSSTVGKTDTYNKKTKVTTENSNNALNGAGVYNEGTLSSTSTKFTNNKAIENGGAVYNSGIADITSSTFQSNTAKNGGAIFSTGEMSIVSSTFKSNTADKGGAIYVGKYSEMYIQDTSFTNNIANVAGGAIFADENSVLYISAVKKNVTFSGNKANGESNSIHLAKDSVLNLGAGKGRSITIKDNITMEEGAVINKYGLDRKSVV